MCQLLHRTRQKLLMLRGVFQLHKVARKIDVARKVHVKKSCNKEDDAGALAKVNCTGYMKESSADTEANCFDKVGSGEDSNSHGIGSCTVSRAWCAGGAG